MRTEEEMLSLILDTARENPLIRGVWMNGSRADPNAHWDRWMDYDIVYAVRRVQPFREEEWIRRFGEICVMQQPNNSPMFPDEKSDPEREHAWLMQFADGTRIDLTLLRLDAAAETYGQDSATVLLLDKDSRFPPMEASDRDYRLQKPNAAVFAGCCNEFWWVAPYVAKGLARTPDNPSEVLFARHALESYVRPMLDKMLGWQVGCAEGFDQSLGKCMKRISRHLSEERWNAYLDCFPSADPRTIGEALCNCCELFAAISREVARELGFSLNETEARNSRAFIRRLLETAGQ